jgi:hypothetical protein
MARTRSKSTTPLTRGTTMPQRLALTKGCCPMELSEEPPSPPMNLNSRRRPNTKAFMGIL